MSKAWLKFLTVFCLLFPLWCFNCGSNLNLVEGGRYRDPQGYFELLFPQGGWTLLSWEEVDLALWNSREQATIVVNVNPLRRNLDLSNLTRHLLIAFERKKIISQDHTHVNGREALKTVLEGWTEGTEVKVEAYVVKGDGVVYDILFWSPLDVFPRKVETFHQFLAGLNFLQPQGFH